MRQAARMLTAIVLLGGCSSNPTTTGPENDLETLRRIGEPFRNFDAAKAAGWSAEITPCMADPAGGMGFHYGKTALIDSEVRVDEPELLLYEPDQNGKLQLVAVEYIIPYTERSKTATPPVLFGQAFSQNDTFQLWALHVWAWKENPSGLYASWNPGVSCAHANRISAMTHH